MTYDIHQLRCAEERRERGVPCYYERPSTSDPPQQGSHAPCTMHRTSRVAGTRSPLTNAHTHTHSLSLLGRARSDTPARRIPPTPARDPLQAASPEPEPEPEPKLEGRTRTHARTRGVGQERMPSPPESTGTYRNTQKTLIIHKPNHPKMIPTRHGGGAHAPNATRQRAEAGSGGAAAADGRTTERAPHARPTT
ncbi:hypothetical protein BC628DRAFT_923120 [Trametes gibbosa]|nr:hypothetical protein BC628DRAFT_923120 [Trametes gibbosa]